MLPYVLYYRKFLLKIIIFLLEYDYFMIVIYKYYYYEVDNSKNG